MGEGTENHITSKFFPNSEKESFLITSPETKTYNCLAWALGDNENWWEADEDSYWLPDLPENDDIATIVLLFEKFGFETCAENGHEVGFEKVALFSKDQIVCTHIARQLDNGFWTSKLGVSYDVQHSLPAMEGGMYGDVYVFLKKQNK
jgi:hypothetical protein